MDVKINYLTSLVPSVKILDLTVQAKDANSQVDPGSSAFKAEPQALVSVRCPEAITKEEEVPSLDPPHFILPVTEEVAAMPREANTEVVTTPLIPLMQCVREPPDDKDGSGHNSPEPSLQCPRGTNEGDKSARIGGVPTLPRRKTTQIRTWRGENKTGKSRAERRNGEETAGNQRQRERRRTSRRRKEEPRRSRPTRRDPGDVDEAAASHEACIKEGGEKKNRGQKAKGPK
ncbi:hypothetical protein NDU88_007062 [Pleurodeles waltl]|uniref:Uncharacterized protein n=1 Tax=Pleurodeles waltl TaxID=8319 RepID=A0AAV7SRE5_PLEWA|nr:hypothetical protein NDU88_007062 [Pleurodeles waltl]